MKFNSLALSKQHASVVFIIATLSLVAFIIEYFLSSSFAQAFIYHRQLITQGEFWRLLSGHLLHTNGYHLLLNLAVLLMLLALHNRFYTIKNYTFLFLFCSLFTSIGIYFFDSTLIKYVGLSGVLHGIFVFGALMDINAKDKTGYLLLLGILIKITHEQLYGASAEVSNLIAANVAINAHLWGALGGLIFSLAYLFIFHKKHSSK